jgi:outer membrane protein assembly factor BamB
MKRLITGRIDEFFSIAVLAVLLVPLHAGDWPQFRGPGGQGVSEETGLPITWNENDNLIWKIDTPCSGNSVPIIVGPRLFLTCYSGFNEPGKPGKMDDLKLHLVCLSRDDGKKMWAKTIDPALPEEPRIRDDHGYATATPIVAEDRVYVFFGKSGVFCYDFAGNELWRADVGSRTNGWGSAASPILVGDLLIVNASVESESIVALDRQTGKEVWRTGGIKESWNTPLLVRSESGRDELIVAIFGKVLGLDPKTGKQLWSCATDIGWYMVPSVVAKDGIVYCIGGRTGGGLAVRTGGAGDVTRTHRLWTSKKGSNVTSPILHEGHLYWMHENLGVAYCADAKTGKIVYEERISGVGQVYASPILAEGRIYHVTREGKMVVLAAKPKFEKLAVNSLGRRETFNAGFAAADGRLYLRSDRALYCIGKK